MASVPISIFSLYLGMMVGSYLLGSFPTGYVVGRFNGIDIRDYGSGKTGGTNVLRTLGWGAMAAVAAADVLKGLAAILITRQITGSPWIVVLCGLAVIAGHNWPLYINFKGGSGVGTGFGVMLGLVPAVALFLFLIFLVTVALSRYMSLGSILVAVCTPILLAAMVWTGRVPSEYALFGVLGAALVLWRHRGNMGRLLAGTERKIGEKVETKREG